jgi:hypothetical protein
MKLTPKASVFARFNLQFLLPLALAACSGSDGEQGPPGPAGPPGDAGPTNTVLERGDSLPGIHLAIVSLGGATGTDGKFAVGDGVAVTFTLKKDDGSDWDITEMNYARMLVSGPTYNYQRVLPEVTDVATAAVANADGSYTYTFANPIPATYAAPYNDTASFGAADGELTGQALLDGTYTLGAYVGWNYTLDGEALRDAGNATQDFLLGASASLAPREVVKQDNCNQCHTSLRAHGELRRDVKLCVLCHTAGAEDKNTAGVAGGTPGVSIEFKVMIHKLHNGGHLPSVLGIATNNDGSRDYAATPAPLEYIGFQDSISDFSEVNFPVWPNLNVAMPKNAGYSQLSSTDPDGAGPLLSPRTRNDTVRTGVTNCAKCHGDPDGTGPETAPAQGDLFKAQPTEQSCGACHDDVRWGFPYTANGSTMPDTANNTNCILCHTASGTSISVEDAHLHPLNNPAVDAGVNSVITAVTGGTGTGGNLQVGDTPTLTFTLQDDAGADIGLASLDACSSFFFGPTTNRQLVMPYTTPNGMSLNPFDFTGRLQAVSTSNKGSMSKVFLGATAVAETLVVEFTSGTAFSVTGTTSGSLGAGTLPASTSTYSSGGSIAAFDLASSLVTGTAQVVFSDATHFTVTATPGGALGSGVLPASTNASTRFTSPTFSFNITVGATAFANGNTFNIGIFKGGAANPVRFAVVAGRGTAFSATAGAPDRFYYEVVPDAPTYTVKVPMDLAFEFLADSTAAAAQALPAAGNIPVYYGRQQLWEAVTTATTTNTSAACTALGRQVEVAAATGFANGDTVVIEPTQGIGVREYLQVAPARADGVIAAVGDTTTRLYFKTPLRYDHGSGVTITKVTLALKQEGAANAYTLNSATGVITSTAAFTASRGLVLSYRSDSRFGYRRHSGDSVQAYYVPPANDSIDIGQEQGEWKGLPYQDGTYTADIWFAKNLDLGLQNELQTYRSTSNAGTADFLYGTATEIVPHAIISSSANCYTCHNDVIFHGGGRRGLDACLTCHSISGNEDKPRWDTPKVGSTTTDTPLTPGVAIEFRQMLHKIHKGSELANAATYTVVGNGGNPSQYAEVQFPAMPGGVRQCIRCHGNDAWKAPAPREHASATVPTRVWGDVCGACHDSDAAQAHISVQTSTGGAESCSVCHGPGKDWNVELMHAVH